MVPVEVAVALTPSPATTTDSTPAKTAVEEEKKAPTAAPAKAPAAKAPPARRRRVAKPKEEKKKEPKIIECTAEIDGEIMAGKSLYVPELDLKEALDLPVVD